MRNGSKRMRSVAILDAGPLVAAADVSDPGHGGSAGVLRRQDLDLVIPSLVMGEATYIIGARFGPKKEVDFLRALDRFVIEPPIDEDWPTIADLLERYADFPLGTADAATIVLADRLETDLIVTLDRRHFAAVQSPKGSHFRLLPEALSVHEEPAPYAAQGADRPRITAIGVAQGETSCRS